MVRGKEVVRSPHGFTKDTRLCKRISTRCRATHSAQGGLHSAAVSRGGSSWDRRPMAPRTGEGLPFLTAGDARPWATPSHDSPRLLQRKCGGIPGIVPAMALRGLSLVLHLLMQCAGRVQAGWAIPLLPGRPGKSACTKSGDNLPTIRAAAARKPIPHGWVTERLAGGLHWSTAHIAFVLH